MEGRTSSADILAALSRAVEGYLPVVTMLGTEGAVQELADTALALGQAGVSKRGGLRLIAEIGYRSKGYILVDHNFSLF